MTTTDADLWTAYDAAKAATDAALADPMLCGGVVHKRNVLCVDLGCRPVVLVGGEEAS